MASTIDIWLDKSGGLIPAGSAQFGSLPALTRNDQYPVRLRVLERNATGSYTDISLVSPSFKLGIGNLGEVPSSGSFKLTLNSTTSSAIPYNATTTQILNAISGIAGNVSVATYGSRDSAWIITAATANTALSFGGDKFTLFPSSSVLINTRRFPASNIYAEQVIELSRDPAAYSDTFTAVSGDGISLTKLQNGSGTTNTTYEIKIANDVIGGSFGLSYGGYSAAFDYSAGASVIGSQLSAITGIGAGNVAVQQNGSRGYIVTFVNQLGLQNVATPLLLDSSGIIGASYYQSTITMSTVQMDDLFAEANSNEITPTLEISLLDSGKEKTLYQGSITVRKDLIASGSAVPADSSQYYTSAQCDSLFIQNSSTNIDSTNRRLKNASGNTIVDYGNASFGYNGMVNLNGSSVTIGGYPVYVGSSVQVAGNIGFYGNTPTAKPSGVNIVSGLTNLGLLSYTQPTAVNIVSALEQTGLIKNNNTTLGVFPLSAKTLMTLSSVSVGTLGAGDSTTITVSVTGARTNDVVLLGLPAGTTTGLIFVGHTSVTDVVDIDVFNYTNQSKTQTALTYRITVIGY